MLQLTPSASGRSFVLRLPSLCFLLLGLLFLTENVLHFQRDQTPLPWNLYQDTHTLIAITTVEFYS